MSNGTVWLSNRKFTSIVHDWSLSFDESATIEEVAEDKLMPGMNAGFTFTAIDQIRTLLNYSTVDMIGILVSQEAVVNVPVKGQMVERK